MSRRWCRLWRTTLSHRTSHQIRIRNAYFGNLHVHTAWSFDANINGAIAGPDEAYRWAQGEAIPGGRGGPDLQILRPLDWYSVGDHAEYLGALPLMADPDSPVSKHPLAGAISWSTYDAAKLGVDVPEGLPTSIQERAWSSPIWYTPE